MNRPTLLGQLSRAHILVVVGTCALLVALSMAGSALLLREHQDRFIETIALEAANGIEVEAEEEGESLEGGATEYFRETRLLGFRIELLSSDGRVLATTGDVPGWDSERYEIPVTAQATTPRLRADASGEGRFRGLARGFGNGHVIRVVTTDDLARPEIRWLGVILLIALPVAAGAGAAIGRTVFRRRLLPLGSLETAAGSTVAAPGASLAVEADVREIVTLRDAFNGLLSRLGEALERERRFSQEASHELRTPLALLRARLERLDLDGSLSVAQRAHVTSALGDVDALDRLIDALLLLARSDAGPLPTTPVNLCDLAREVAARQAASDGPQCRAPEVDAPDEILVRGSEELLTRAIANLVENARKFAGPRARVRIRVTHNGAKATVSVADDGPGISSADRESVFERFFRAAASRSSTPGVGLGLAVVRAIARRHHGEIAARQSDLGGAEMSIALPLLSA